MTIHDSERSERNDGKTIMTANNLNTKVSSRGLFPCCNTGGCDVFLCQNKDRVV
jgi:hypothetical protein